MESINLVLCPSSPPSSQCGQILNLLRKEHSTSHWRTLWGLPLNRLFQSNQNTTSITVVLCSCATSETNRLINHQLADPNLDVVTTQLLALGHTIQNFPSSECACQSIQSPHVKLQLVPTLEFSDQLRLVCDCLLMLTSPTFLKAMSTGVKYSASELKGHLLRLRSSEVPIAKRGLNYDCPQLRAMIAGEDYNPNEPKLQEARTECRQLCRDFLDTSDKGESSLSQSALQLLIGSETNSSMWMEAPVRFDYGFNTFIDDDVYMNFDCLLLDTGLIRIKSGTKFGPAVHLYTASHPLEPSLRLKRIDFNLPIEIGYDCWIGGHSIIVPGVRIGDGVTVAAGSVVTKDVPNGSIVAGVPARIVRKVKYDYKEMHETRQTLKAQQPRIDHPHYTLHKN